MMRFPQFPFIFFEITKCASDWGWMVNGQTVGRSITVCTKNYRCQKNVQQQIQAWLKRHASPLRQSPRSQKWHAGLGDCGAA